MLDSGITTSYLNKTMGLFTFSRCKDSVNLNLCSWRISTLTAKNWREDGQITARQRKTGGWKVHCGDGLLTLAEHLEGDVSINQAAVTDAYIHSAHS